MIVLYTLAEDNLSPISLSKDMYKEYNRVDNFSKTDILKSCWLSLQNSIDSEDLVVVTAANCTKELLQWIKETSKSKLQIVPVKGMRDYTPPYGEHPYKEYHENGVNQFIPQYELFYRLIEENPEELFYFCNDDYLHIPDAVHKVKNVYKSGYNQFFVPQDNPDCYQEHTNQCNIFLSTQGYLRTVKSSTPTIVAPGKLWLFYKYEIMRACVFASDSWTWKAFAEVKALTPIPGWSTHFQNRCMAPYVDWIKLAKQYLGENS